MTSPRIRSVLDEIYQLDPDLRTREQELIPIIETLLEHNPSHAPDATFVERLRAELKTHARVLQEQGTSAGWNMRNLSFLFSGAVVAALIVAPLTYMAMNGGFTQQSGTTSGMFAYSITKTSDRAFGSLPGTATVTDAARTTGTPTNARNTTDGSEKAAQPPVSADPVANDPVAVDDSTGTSQARGMTPVKDPSAGDTDITTTGARGMATVEDAPPPTADPIAPTGNPVRPQSGGGGGNAKIMIYPPMDVTQYEYVFNGELPALTDKTVSVYKRDPKNNSLPLTSISKSFNIGNMNLNSFNGAKVDSLTFMQDTPYGYMVSIQMRDGSVSISQNWEQWPHPENNCQDEACFSRYRTKLSDLIAEDVLIKTATDFATAHGFDLSHYGQPEVDNYWRVEYERMEDKTYAYIPDSQRVVFPLLIEGKAVYDENGSKTGISIGVNVREKRVSDVYGLMSQNFLSSNYDAVTSAEDVKAYLKTVDNYPIMPMDIQARPSKPATKKVQITLGTPTMGLVRTYHTVNNISEEVIVPALIFPTEKPADSTQWYRQVITVPLAKDMLVPAMDGRPMPLMERMK